MNFECKIIHYNNDQTIYHTDINSINKTDVVHVDFTNLINREDIFVYDIDHDINYTCDLPFAKNITFKYLPASSSYTIQDEKKKFFCWDKNNYSFSRDDANLWEYFLLVDDLFIEKILYIKSNRWISKRNGKLYNPEDIFLKNDFILQIGEFSIDLRQLTLNDLREYDFLAICDQWKPEVFLLFRPLIYITTYSSKPVFEQLQLCIRSIRNIGQYNDKIVVMTNESKQFILDLCNEDEEKLDIDIKYPKDFVGYVCSKFDIYQSEVYKNYQPLLYLDPDIIFDKPMERMLIEATLANEICTPLETFHRLNTHVATGGGLIQMDQLPCSPYAAGFNGGTLSIPNVDNKDVKETIYLIQKTITNLGYYFGRTFNKWADQEVLNYIALKFNKVNTSMFTKYANYIRNDPYNNRRGFVHFWGHSTENKVIEMRKYLLALDKIYNN